MIDFRAVYDRLQRLPAGIGTRLFEWIAWTQVPHAKPLGFRILELSETRIRMSMPDKRSNRNHLRSLHAMALAHLAEITSGLLLLYAVSPNGYRTILKRYQIEYLAKARGRIVARATLVLPKGSLDKKDVPVPVELVDAQGTVVARARPVWRVGRTGARGGPGGSPNGRT